MASFLSGVGAGLRACPEFGQPQGVAPTFRLEPCALGAQSDAVDGRAACDVQHRAVLAPGHVRRRQICFDAAEMRAVRRKDADAARPRPEEIAVPVDLHPVWPEVWVLSPAG